MRYDEIVAHRVAAPPVERNGAVFRGLAALARALGTRSTPLLPLAVLVALPGFVRHLVLGLVDEHFADGDLRRAPGMDEATWFDFVRLAESVGLVVHDPRGPRLDRAYRHGCTGAAAARAAARADHDHVVDLVTRAAAPAPPAGLRRDDVCYLLVLAQYVRELAAMSFHGQVRPSFTEEFYSELGALAFDLYTREPFRRLVRRLGPGSMLDVGCGEGRHLAVAAEVSATLTRAVGVERQAAVAQHARDRLAHLPGVEVRTGPLIEVLGDETFDLVLSSFMIFYLARDERAALYARVRDALAPGGTYVIGQYFPDVEGMQEVLVRRTSPVAGIQLALCSVGNVLVRAEALLNRTLSDFASVAYWQETVEELAQAGLAVDEVLPADSMSYSYFVLVRRAERVHDDRHAPQEVSA